MNPAPQSSPTRFGSPQAQASRFSSRSKTAKLAGALLSLIAAVSTAHAQSTWVGDTSQDWNNAANWSSDPANPTGNFLINTATGNYPVISANSAFTPVDIIIGSAAGLTGRLDQTAGNVSTGTGNWALIGVEGGTGTYNLSGGSLSAQEFHMARTGTTATSTVTVGGTGTISTLGAVVVADGTNNTATAVGTLNVNSGGTINSEGDLLVSFAGGANTSGTVNIAAGATVNVASVTKRWLIMNFWDSAKGQLNVNGGTLNLNANTDIRFSVGNWGPGASNGPSSITLNSGAINGGAAAVVDLNNNADRAVSSTLNLNGGTLTISQIISGKATGARVVNFNGGTLKASAASATFLGATAASAANVLAGGAIIDSNGFDITIAKALTADAVSTGGGLVKQGAGTLTLGGVNTYTGNTTISGGGLALADNASLKFKIGATGVNTKVTGTGPFAIDGDFEFDLTGAGTTQGTTWPIVDTSTVTATFGATFTVTGFTVSGTKFVKPANGTFYEFDPATAALRVIADPGLAYAPPTATQGVYNTTYVTGSDIVLSVSASGLGELSYQWYLNTGSGPQAISGATGSTLTVPAATAANGGVYSVIVTDHAAEASGQPPTTVTSTFNTIAVVPASSLAVAYYRFEEGANGNTISAATDSAGANPLTALGAPVYTNASVPYATIPSTGAANTLGANFPASGNNGLLAATTGALAETAFTDFTIEAFVRLSTLGGWQTIVGRDDSAQGAGDQSLFYLSKSGADNGFRVEVITKDNTSVQVNSTFVPTVGTWYHVAAVGNAIKGTLTLYVNGVSVGSTPGFTGLFVPTAASDTAWTIGRGDYNNADVDYFRGDIDEVRITRAAVPPSQFLNSAGGVPVVNPTASISPAAVTIGTGQSATLTATAASNMGGTLSYQWYKDGSPLASQTGSTLIVAGTATTASGAYSVVVTDSAGTAAGISVTASASSNLRVITGTAPGARSLGLNFVGASTGGSFSTELGILAPGVSAGFYSAANWNNSATVNYVAVQTTPLALTEQNGSVAAGATATWNSANTWALRPNTGVVAAKAHGTLLLHGYIESRATTGATVSVSNIPYGSYDVYVYVSGGSNGGANVGSLTIDRTGAPTYYYRALQHDSYAPAVLPTVENPYTLPSMIGDAADRAGAIAAPPATFVRFTGVTGSDLTISAIDQTLNANSGGIAAIQIVDTTPPGSAYPPVVGTAPVSKLVKGGSTATFTVAAQSQNSGTLSYQWKKNDANLTGQTSATLTLANVTGADSANYSVVVTDASSAGTTTATRTASLVVVDGTRSVLINGDLNTGASTTFATNGVLTAADQQAPGAFAQSASTWNGLLGGGGTATLALSRESTGLSLPGLTFTYADAAGVEDDILKDLIADSVSFGLMRDYLYTDSTTVTLKAKIGGLESFAGHRFTLLVYSFGKDTTGQLEATTEDASTVSLDASNNHLSLAAQATKPYITEFTFANAARRVEANNPVNTGGTASAYVAFSGVVAADGTISWALGADADLGRIALNGFQLLLTSENLAPAAPTNLVATAGNSQVGLSWTASANATSYTIRRGTASGVYATVSAGAVTGTTYTDTGLTAGTTYYYVVAAANGIITGVGSNEVSATPTASLTGIESWRQANFGITTNSGNAANTFDADKDGQVNLLEYALGTNPNVAGALPVTVARSGSFLTLSFSHAGDSSLVYTIEASNDLATWTVVRTYPAFTTTGTETYTDDAPLSGQARRFLRLGVTAP